MLYNIACSKGIVVEIEVKMQLIHKKVAVLGINTK